MKTHIFLFLLLSSNFLLCQEMTSEALLEKSIAYHDPNGNWNQFKGEFTIKMETPNRPERTTQIALDFPKQFFQSIVTLDGRTTQAEWKAGTCSHWLNGSSSFTEMEAKKHRLNCEQTTKMRNYYVYLYGLPMKLKDPGTRIDPKVYKKALKGIVYNCIKVSYDEVVGKDTWYFYFDTKTHQLKHYQFYHDEAKNDGEYILMSDEAVVQGIKMPKVREWYTNSEDRYLGTDVLYVKD